MRLPTTPVTTLQRSLRDEARRDHPAGRVVVAVDGDDRTGASVFADGLADAFAEEGAAVYRASLEGFRLPRAERRVGGDDPRIGGYDVRTFRRVLIDPFRTGGSAGFHLVAFDADRDVPVEAAWVTAPRDAVLVVDGPVLGSTDLHDVWDWSLRVETAPDAGASVRPPASAVVDNADARHPVRIPGGAL